MPNLPGGTVTFLFTDIEGSTKLWERSPEASANERGSVVKVGNAGGESPWLHEA